MYKYIVMLRKGALGAVLLQEGRPVACGLRTFTETEKKYAYLEKESLAIIFYC